MDVRGKVALITGAGSGIGEATALRLAAEGASVVVADVNEDGGRGTVSRIEGTGNRAAFVCADVSIDDDVRNMVDFAQSTYGGLDVLVNNAGVYVGAPYFPDAEPEQWGRILDVYLRGVMLGTQYAVAAMKRREGGAIVNISSGAGVGYGPHDAPEYAAAKAAVVRLTAALAPLADRLNVRVNCVCPGWVDTPASRRTREEMTPTERETVPASMLEPDDVADAVLELIGDESLAGRVMLYYVPGKRRLVPAETSV